MLLNSRRNPAGHFGRSHGPTSVHAEWMRCNSDRRRLTASSQKAHGSLPPFRPSTSTTCNPAGAGRPIAYSSPECKAPCWSHPPLCALPSRTDRHDLAPDQTASCSHEGANRNPVGSSAGNCRRCRGEPSRSHQRISPGLPSESRSETRCVPSCPPALRWRRAPLRQPVIRSLTRQFRGVQPACAALP